MLDSASQTIGSLVGLGGPVVGILLALSVIALALILLKLYQFWTERVGRHGNARRAVDRWREGRFADALGLIENDRSAPGHALREAMQLARDRHGKSELEEEVQNVALVRMHGLQRGFRALDAIAQIAPLLGLFGTVLGMIEAFRQLQSAGNAVDPSMLAGGIWVALLTTAVGLAVAMPVSLVLTWFESRVENERVTIETLTGVLLSQRAVSAAVPEAEAAFAGEGSRAH